MGMDIGISFETRMEVTGIVIPVQYWLLNSWCWSGEKGE